MPGNLLTTASRILCPHGGMLVLKTSNTTTSAGAKVLLESDVHEVRNCPFTIGTKYTPCKTVSWKTGGSVTVGGKKVLVRSSIGQCKSGENVIQGIAVIATTQLRAKESR